MHDSLSTPWNLSTATFTCILVKAATPALPFQNWNNFKAFPSPDTIKCVQRGHAETHSIPLLRHCSPPACIWRRVLQPKILMTAWILCASAAASPSAADLTLNILCNQKACTYIIVIRTKEQLQHNLTVPPGGQTMLLPSVRMFSLISPFICCSSPSDNLEMSSESNIFIYEAVWWIEWKQCVTASKDRKTARMYGCIQAGCFGTTCKKKIQNKKIVFLYKRVFLLLFCCKEERMYKLGLYVMGVIW